MQKKWRCITLADKKLTHISDGGEPRMVDISAKARTLRTATAHARVLFPMALAQQLRDQGYIAKKGAVLHTAIIAGVMAAKQTHQLIPFCHALQLQRCEVRITPDADGQLDIECECAVHGETGVEMEALTGASIAALPIYDMTKALSHLIQIVQVRLVSKSGGKTDLLPPCT
jgi:cyclic pyranopterin monophosphate synthase